MFVVALIGCTPDTGPEVERLLAALPAETRIVQRAPGGRPVVAVVELAAGDPRGTGGEGGLAVLEALLPHAEVFLSSGDGADALLEEAEPGQRARIHLQPAGDGEALRAMRRFAGFVSEVETPLAGLRDMVLSRAAPEGTVEQYTRLRTGSLQRFEALQTELAGRGQRLAEVALSEEGPVALGVPALAGPAAVERLKDAGATVVYLRPSELDALQDEAMWWAGLHAALPPVLPPEQALPSFEAWVEALKPAATAVAGWDEAEQVRRDITAAVGPMPPELPADDPRRALLLEAARRLAEHPHPALGDPVATLASLKLCERPLQGTPMSYDPWFDALKVDRWVEELPLELVAAVLAHELVHVRDLRGAASQLGTDLPGWSMVHDTLPAGVMRGVTFLAEDRAFRVEVQLIDALGIELPLPEEASRVIENPTSPEPERLKATLALLRSAGPGSLPWMQQLARMVPTPR